MRVGVELDVFRRSDCGDERDAIFSGQICVTVFFIASIKLQHADDCKSKFLRGFMVA